MALNAVSVKLLAPFLRGADVLSLGYPDLLIGTEQCEKLLGVTPEKFSNAGLWHGVKEPIPETLHVMEKLGARFVCVDLRRSRDIEIEADLNFPWDGGKFDVVIDAGTTEHCFNVAQAIMNAAGSVKPGGRVFHFSPMTMVNHGFYNFSPTLFHDFYKQNGWAIEALMLRGRRGAIVGYETLRFIAEPESAIYFSARRLSAGQLVYPIQTKYLVHPDLKAA